jgi:regulator of replication initiation timing
MREYQQTWEQYKEQARDAAVTEVGAKYLDSMSQIKALNKRLDEVIKENQGLAITIGALSEKVEKMAEFLRTKAKESKPKA